MQVVFINKTPVFSYTLNSTPVWEFRENGERILIRHDIELWFETLLGSLGQEFEADVFTVTIDGKTYTDCYVIEKSVRTTDFKIVEMHIKGVYR